MSPLFGYTFNVTVTVYTGSNYIIGVHLLKWFDLNLSFRSGESLKWAWFKWKNNDLSRDETKNQKWKLLNPIHQNVLIFSLSQLQWVCEISASEFTSKLQGTEWLQAEAECTFTNTWNSSGTLSSRPGLFFFVNNRKGLVMLFLLTILIIRFVPNSDPNLTHISTKR